MKTFNELKEQVGIYSRIDEARVDDAIAIELMLFIQNNARLNKQRIVPIQKNLITKMAREQYDSKKAVKLWMYAVKDAVKDYQKEYGDFPIDKDTQMRVAELLVQEFEDEAELGNYDHLLPKKYQVKENPDYDEDLSTMNIGEAKSIPLVSRGQGTSRVDTHPSDAERLYQAKDKKEYEKLMDAGVDAMTKGLIAKFGIVGDYKKFTVNIKFKDAKSRKKFERTNKIEESVQVDEMSAKAHYKKYQNKFIVPPIDRERHPNREKEGLEGPYRSKKSGKIFYYDKKAGKYYDTETDMYLAVSDVMESALNELRKDVFCIVDRKGKVLAANLDRKQSHKEADKHKNVTIVLDPDAKVGDTLSYFAEAKKYVPSRRELKKFADNIKDWSDMEMRGTDSRDDKEEIKQQEMELRKVASALSKGQTNKAFTMWSNMDSDMQDTAPDSIYKKLDAMYESVKLFERDAYQFAPDRKILKGIESGKFPMVNSAPSHLGGNTVFGVFQFTGKAAGGGPEPGSKGVDGYVMAIVSNPKRKPLKLFAYYGSHPDKDWAITKFAKSKGLLESTLSEADDYTLAFQFTIEYDSEDAQHILGDLEKKFRKTYSGSGSGGEGFDVSFDGPERELKKVKKYVEKEFGPLINSKDTYFAQNESVELDEAWTADSVTRNAEIGSKKGYGINIKKTGGVTKTPYKHMLMTTRSRGNVRVTFDHGKEEFEGTPQSVALHINKLLGIKESVELDEASKFEKMMKAWDASDDKKVMDILKSKMDPQHFGNLNTSNGGVGLLNIIAFSLKAAKGNVKKAAELTLAKYGKNHNEYKKLAMKLNNPIHQKGAVDEDAPANSMGGGFASSQVGEPGAFAGHHDPKAKKKRRSDKFANCEVFKVDSKTYQACKSGKGKGARWSKHLNVESDLGKKIRSYSYKNPNRGIVIQDEESGDMMYLRRRWNDNRLKHNRSK